MTLLDIVKDVERIRGIGNPFASHLEGYAALLADVQELWEDIKANNDILAMSQAETVAGTAVRFIVDRFEIPASIALGDMVAELDRARGLFPEFNSAHEGAAVLLEELDELWEAVRDDRRISKTGDPMDLAAGARKHIAEEAIQVGAMALRMLVDCYGVELEIGPPKEGAS